MNSTNTIRQKQITWTTPEIPLNQQGQVPLPEEAWSEVMRGLLPERPFTTMGKKPAWLCKGHQSHASHTRDMQGAICSDNA